MAAWQVSHNWREVKIPTGNDLLAKSWIPPCPDDRIHDVIEVLSREPKDADFLRPANDSPLATQGAGSTTVDRPKYVGAIPPEGVETWDWQLTWDARHKHLFTVSADPKTGGEFRSIDAALAKARPGCTIRVLDNARYEGIVIRSRSQHEGITLESPRGATITCPTESMYAILVLHVPRVTLQGFRVELERAEMFGVMLGGASPGCVVREVECTFTKPSINKGAGIGVEELVVADDEPPAVIENCRFPYCPTAVQVTGLNFTTLAAKPCGGVSIRGNRIWGGQTGIGLTGQITDVQVVANKFWDLSAYDVLLVDLLAGSRRILVANNSIKDSTKGIGLGDFASDVRDIEIKNNLLLAEHGPDIMFGGTNRNSVEVAQIANNWRSVRAPSSAGPEWVLSAQDTFRERIELLSLDPAHADFLRPKSDSELATTGAGKDDPSLPLYVGAVPPQDTTWDWDKTWQLRAGKTTP
jgi:hypothetical protein